MKWGKLWKYWIYTIKTESNYQKHIYVVQKLKETKIQEDEVINIKWVEKAEIKKMFERDEIVEPLSYICELIDKNIV